MVFIAFTTLPPKQAHTRAHTHAHLDTQACGGVSVGQPRSCKMNAHVALALLVFSIWLRTDRDYSDDLLFPQLQACIL